jgi:nucleotide-binding universal stress UspA family protein
MKILMPVDGSKAALAPVARLAELQRAGTPLEVIVVNVQPRFSRHISQFTSRAARDALRAERSSAAVAQALELLWAAGVRCRAIAETGGPAERIAVVASRERVDEIMMGVGRHPAWLRLLNPSIAEGVMARTDIPVTVLARGRPGAFERYALPAGLAGLAALLFSAE